MRSVPALTERTTADRLGDYLIRAGKLSREGLESASRLAQTNAEHLGTVLVKLGQVSERDLAEALAALLEFPLLAADNYPDTPIYEEQVSAKFLKTARAIPVCEQDGALVVAMAMPEDTYVIEVLELACGRPVRAAIGVTSEILAAIERLYGTGKTVLDQIVDDIETRTEVSEQEDIERLKDLASEAPIVRLVNHLINRAIDSRASDIHIEPFENRLKVRYRIDGVLHEVESPPARSTAAVISRVKIMAKLNIAERRLPQDGRIQLRVQGKEIDLRISTVPT
ncbi:MAG: GspE/PulE family protein, partial [Gammaproteobacteria bacterium]